LKLSYSTLALTLLATPALADTASFEQAFANICLQSLPTMAPARDAFKANGWEEYQGAGPNEFEYAKGSSHVFLLIGAPDMQPGCTVMDEAVSMSAAKQVLEKSLEGYFPGNVEVVTGDYGPYWKLYLDDGYLAITVQEGMGGGGAISFELRPDE